MACSESRHRLFSQVVHIVVVAGTVCFANSAQSSLILNSGQSQLFSSCVNVTEKSSHSGPEPCQCDPEFPIVLDNRICLPLRLFNQTCVLTEQCVGSKVGCFKNGVNLMEAHDGLKHLVDIISRGSSKPGVRARCRCAPNHFYDPESRNCLCQTNSTNKKCLIKSWHLITDQEYTSTRVHFAETIVFWIILMLILTLIFMVLTICRKCFCSDSSYVDYRAVCTTSTTTTLIDMTFINNTNDRLNSIASNEDRPPTYEEAIRAQA